MSWKRNVFGNDDPSRVRIIACVSAYACVAMAIHGWFAPVVPAPWLRGVPGAVIMLSLALSFAVACALAVPVRPPRITTGGFGYPQADDAGEGGQSMLAAVGAGVLVSPLLWLALAKSLPWMLAGIFGSAHEETTTLRLEHHYSRRSCDYRAFGPVLESTIPNYICVSREHYQAHPDRTFPVVLVGRGTPLGWRIDGYRVQQQ